MESKTSPSGQLKTDKLFIAMLAILVCQVSMVQGETYWTYYPNPPTLVPITWEDRPIMVWVNSSVPIGGTIKNIKPQRTNFNYVGLTHTTPICASEENITGCLVLSIFYIQSSDSSKLGYMAPTSGLLKNYTVQTEIWRLWAASNAMT